MPHVSAGQVVRRVFAAGAIIFGATGLITGRSQLLVAAGAFGILWTAWDLFLAWIVSPLVELAHDVWQGSGIPHVPKQQQDVEKRDVEKTDVEKN